MKKLLLPTILLIATAANAHHHYHDYDYDNCVETNYSLISSNVRVGSCDEGQALQLVQIFASYENLKDSPYPVRIWEGGYKKSVQETNVYKKQLIDICHGKILSEGQETQIGSVQFQEFTIENPNLNPYLASTIELAPLTEEEAKQALQKKLQECQESKL